MLILHMLKDTCIKYKMLLPAVVSINKYKKSIVWQQMVFLPTLANRSVGPRAGHKNRLLLWRQPDQRNPGTAGLYWYKNVLRH